MYPERSATVSWNFRVGADRASRLAEICAAVALAGELSIVGALCAGDFARAHAVYGRSKSSK